MPKSTETSFKYFQVRSPIRSKPVSVNLDSWSSLILVPIINPSPRPLMPTSPLLLFAMWTHPPSTSIYASLATIRETSPLDWCGGSWPVRSCVSVESSPVSSPGKSCPICSSTGTFLALYRMSQQVLDGNLKKVAKLELWRICLTILTFQFLFLLNPKPKLIGTSSTSPTATLRKILPWFERSAKYTWKWGVDCHSL